MMSGCFYCIGSLSCSIVYRCGSILKQVGQWCSGKRSIPEPLFNHQEIAPTSKITAPESCSHQELSSTPATLVLEEPVASNVEPEDSSANKAIPINTVESKTIFTPMMELVEKKTIPNEVTFANPQFLPPRAWGYYYGAVYRFSISPLVTATERSTVVYRF